VQNNEGPDRANVIVFGCKTLKAFFESAEQSIASKRTVSFQEALKEKRQRSPKRICI